MSEFARLIVLLVLAGGGLTALGGGAIWYMEEGRRVHRALKRVLGANPEGMLLAAGTGRGTAFAFATNQMAVTWDAGAWCLVYSLDELVGAELIADGEVLGRAHRGEPRRPLDRAPREASQITLRILFDDPAHPDFQLDLWNTDVPRRDGGPASPAGAVQEANRWLARAEAILRRQTAGVKPMSNVASATAAAAAAAAVRPRPAAPAASPPPSPSQPSGHDDEDDFDDGAPKARDRHDDEDPDDEALDEEPPF
jgi:hypothetical protein